MLAKLSTFFTLDVLGHISDLESSISLDTSNLYITFSFWNRHMVLASFKFFSWMYAHYYWQMVQLSISRALLPSPSKHFEIRLPFWYIIRIRFQYKHPIEIFT